MNFICQNSKLSGEILIPGSKSHTIRGLALAALAEGESVLYQPLSAADTLSAAAAMTAFGADVEQKTGEWTIHGSGSISCPQFSPVNVGNSGTTLNISLGMASLMPAGSRIDFTGDSQIKKRPVEPLLKSIVELGAEAWSHRGNGCPPLTIGGRLQGGETTLEARNSQYLTSLLIACPLADKTSKINVPLLFEAAYVRMTLEWLQKQNIDIEYTPELNLFHIPGGQSYQSFSCRIPADFSSAAFFLAAGAMPNNNIVCRGLDMADSQGDKAVVDYLRAMGAKVTVDSRGIRVEPGCLRGIEIDMNDTPDALPVMAVLACFAEGETRLVNVPQARIKETDRIAVMAEELAKMGADIEELNDGLKIRESKLRGTAVNGHLDHRVIMALALAGLNSPGRTTVSTAEAAAVTFPFFHKMMQELGGDIQQEDGCPS